MRTAEILNDVMALYGYGSLEPWQIADVINDSDVSHDTFNDYIFYMDDKEMVMFLEDWHDWFKE